MARFFMAVALCCAAALWCRPALADGYDDCRGACDKEYNACVAKANEFVNDIEVADAKAICNSTQNSCHDNCMSIEVSHGFDKPVEKPAEKPAEQQ